MAPRGGIVLAEDARNLITLSGNRQDIASMMEAIALFDIDTMKGMSGSTGLRRAAYPPIFCISASDTSKLA